MEYYYKINENNILTDVYLFASPPLIEAEGEFIPDPTFVAEPIPNDVFTDLGVSPRWDGEKWVAAAEPPEPIVPEPTETEKLEAKINAANEYTDFLEEVIVEMAQAVYG